MAERIRILLEGNIGAGKSTIGRALKASGLFDFIEEPVEEWKSGFGSNMLDLFYHDMKRWAFTFQLTTFVTRCKTWNEISALTTHPRVLLERSIYTDRYVFAPTLHQIGAINADEWLIYCRLWDFAVANSDVTPDCILYLRTPAEVCLERIRQRRRGEESEVTLDYLQQLEALHDQWLLNWPGVVLLDGTRSWSAQDVLHLIEVPKR